MDKQNLEVGQEFIGSRYKDKSDDPAHLVVTKRSPKGTFVEVGEVGYRSKKMVHIKDLLVHEMFPPPSEKPSLWQKLKNSFS